MKSFLCQMILLFMLSFGLFSPLSAQTVDTSSFRHLRWRMIGPHRGGRTVGVAGIPDQPNVFYIGVNNGGVWRTNDYGRTWKPIFDDQPTGSIGAVAVAPSNPDILYVGSGEGLQRPDLSVGDGMFKSVDGGKSWRHIGLEDAQQIGSVIIDPHDPNRVFVAALGHPYGANEQRGVFRSTNGGASWEKVLYKDENTGAIGLAFDPTNPLTLFADLWSSRQGPWENGSWRGKTNGLYKSTDGGTTWRPLTNGLPTAEQGLGRIGFTIAPGDPMRMFAMVDATSLGGVYRSDDGGGNWNRVNSEDRVNGRGDDFAEVKVDPKNKDIVYVANTQTYRSTDGGVTFTGFKGAPGGDDYHTIWINPNHPEIILLASDQGAVVSVNGGETWGSWYNQPTAQFYHVITDNQFPYNVYGGQQESGSAGIASRGNDGQITFREWHPVGADEYGYIAPDPLHPNIIFGGRVTRFDKTTGEVQNVAPEAVRSGKYRNLRTAPLVFSPVDPHALYFATNVLFKTTNGGHRWDAISPDLSREKPDVPASIGIFTTPELAKQARRGVIYAVSPSPRDAKIIWAGTDDGYIHMTNDGGKQWKNVTPASMTSWSKVAGIESGHFDSKTAYAAVNRIKLDDMHPHIYRTHDNGATWQEIVTGLPESGPVNVVREDPVRKGLLFAGTERAVYVSFDDGDHWLSLRNNMPATSIRDLVIHNADIAVATHGRSFWILDDITSLRQMNDAILRSSAYLFNPEPAVRVRWNLNTDTPIPPDEPAGENPPDGAIIDYYLQSDAREVTLEITDASHQLVRRYSSSDLPESVNEKELRAPSYWIRPPISLSATKGTHRFIWNMHYAPPDSLPRSFPISAVVHNTASQPLGPFAIPGTYRVTLSADGKMYSQPMTITMDPRVTATQAVLKEQFELSTICYHGLDQVQHVVREIHAIRTQVSAITSTTTESVVKDSLASFGKKLSALEGDGPPQDVDIVYFTVESGEKVKETLNGLQTKLLYIMTLLQSADADPTEAQKTAVHNESEMLHAMEQRWKSYRGTALPAVNQMLKEHHLELLKAAF